MRVLIFTTSSFVVDRARPGVPKLDTIPPTSSFPSGHAAAAVAFYGALAIIVFWHTRHRVTRAVVVGAAIVFPLVVGASRMYRGMHHLSDVIVGFVVGTAAATDTDTGQSLTFAITAGSTNDNKLNMLATGAYLFLISPEYLVQK